MPTVLVTGGAGYLGSALVRDLAADDRFDGWTIRILDSLQRGTHAGLVDLPTNRRFQFMEGDILDPGTMARALVDVEAVIHLAALVRTPFSSDHPSWTEHVNHWGTARLVEDCLDAGVTRVILASSAGVYGPGGPFAEDAPTRPIGAYSRSKLGAERTVERAGDRGVEWTILRLGTIYGHAPAVRFDAMPNRLAYRLAIGRSLVVHGTGDQVRPLIHVRDACAAIRLCLTRSADTGGRIFNVVGRNLSVREVTEVLREQREGAQVRYTDQDELTRFSLSLDGSSLEALGWQPAADVSRGLGELLYRLGPFEPVREASDMAALLATET